MIFHKKGLHRTTTQLPPHLLTPLSSQDSYRNSRMQRQMPEYELFCLIEINEKVSKPFSVEIAGDESVHKLKERIKDKKQNDLKDVDAYRLMLERWTHQTIRILILQALLLKMN